MGFRDKYGKKLTDEQAVKTFGGHKKFEEHFAKEAAKMSDFDKAATSKGGYDPALARAKGYKDLHDKLSRKK